MSERVRATLAYTGAGFMLLIAACVPFVLYPAFTNAIGRAGLHIDPAYSGGTVARTIQKNGYHVAVYQPVHPRMFERIEPFVQVVFEPAASLPTYVDEAIDLDGDGQPDVRVSLTLPADPSAPLHGSVIALNANYVSITDAADASFSRLIVRTGDKIVVRIPLNKESASADGVGHQCSAA